MNALYPVADLFNLQEYGYIILHDFMFVNRKFNNYSYFSDDMTVELRKFFSRYPQFLMIICSDSLHFISSDIIVINFKFGNISLIS